MMLQDAVTAAALLPVGQDNWDVSRGYPMFVFGSENIDVYAQQLVNAGYTVRVLVPEDHVRTKAPARRRGQVVSISVARARRKREAAR
jgi:hypothetical protein